MGVGLVRRAPSGPKPSQVRESPVDQFIKKWPRRARRGEGLLRGHFASSQAKKPTGLNRFLSAGSEHKKWPRKSITGPSERVPGRFRTPWRRNPVDDPASGIIGKSQTAIDPKSSLCVRTASACSSHMALEQCTLVAYIHDRTGYTTIFVTHDQGEALS